MDKRTDDGLEGLDALRDEHEEHAEDLQTRGDRLGRAGVLTEDAPSGEERRRKVRGSDQNEGEENDEQRGPFRLIQRLFQPVLTNETRKKNNRATDHLPNGYRDPQQPNKHNERGQKVAKSGIKDLVIHTLLRTLIVLVPINKWRNKAKYRILSASSGFIAILRSFAQALIYLQEIH